MCDIMVDMTMTSSKDTLFKEALRQHRLNEYVGAERCYRKLLEDDRINGGLWHLLAILYAQQRRYQEAIPLFESALALQKNATIYNNLAKSYHALGQSEQAIRMYKKALCQKADYAVAHCGLADVYLKNAQYKKASQHYQKAISIRRGYGDAYYGMALVALKEQNLQSAMAYLQETLALRANYGPAHTQLAQLYFQEGRYEKAARHYQERLSSEPQHAISLLGLGATFIKQGKLESGIEQLKESIQVDPQLVEAYQNLATVYLDMGQYQFSLKYTLLIYQKQPTVENRFQLGLVYMMMERHREAIENFQAILLEDSQHFNAHMNLGTVYLKLRKYPKAIKHYKQALRLRPTDQQIAYLLQALEQKSEKTCPERAPLIYVKNLFDQYAPYFDQHLNQYLHYDVPQQLEKLVEQDVMPKITSDHISILDLGCGTGLCGERLVKFSNNLMGIDISERMIDIAKKKKIYHQLVSDDILSFTTEKSDWDLLIAGDTLPYFGNLMHIFKLASQLTHSKGFFAFTIEKAGKSPYQLQQTARYAHHHSYIETLANDHKWSILCYQSIVSRYHHNSPINGSLYLLQR